MTPIYAGHSRALCRLKSGGYICVDTNSLDSIDYLLGFEVEADVMRVFDRFLTPSSVVLDIGANFGLYTVAAGNVIQHYGRIYAFEGNPHTFDLLQRSVYANRLLENPNVILVNALVSNRNGRGQLNYEPDRVGGGTMRDVPQLSGHWTSVEAEMVTIDGFLPPELSVDLVKIDVEGHEPYVLKGMERTIANSPGIRVIIEFFHSLIDPAFGADKLIHYIRDLGLEICKIEAGGRLALLDRKQEPPGDSYLLLTRTPHEDIARDYASIPMASFFFPPGLGAVNGEFVYDSDRQPGPPDSVLLYGPYLSLSPGRYAFSFVGTINGKLSVRFTCQFGRVILRTEILDNFDAPVLIQIDELAEHFEIVAYRTDSLKSVLLSEIRLVTL